MIARLSIIPLMGLLLSLGLAAAAAPTAARVTLPDSGTYAYWLQAKSGAVSTMPTTVTGQKQISLSGGIGNGETLYVLDKHTGNIATVPLSAPSSGAAHPVTLSVGDFKPLTSAAVVSAAPSPAPPAAPAPKPAPDTGNGVGHLITAFFGLVVAAGVGWVIWRLLVLRGQPLIVLARRLGHDIPDPTAADAETEAAPVYVPPAPRPVEKIPDEAGAPPPPAAPVHRAAIGALDVPQIVGIQGVAAGSSFAVPEGEVLIGRDGDNGIVLAESTVSRRHARLVRDSAGSITLTDEGSANGIYVNGHRVTQASLNPGDQIQIGDSHFRLEA